MAARRVRKRHVQLDLLKRRRRRTPGVRLGRPPKGARAGSPHTRRPVLKARFPVHVVLRTVAAVGSLRKRGIYQALREATIAMALRELNAKQDGAFRIVHVSLQRTHVHLLVEADHRTALSRGLQGFQISRRQAHQPRGQPARRPAAPRHGVPRPLPRADHRDPAAGAPRARLRAQQLAQAPRGSRRAGEVMERRSVLDRRAVPGLEGARARGPDVEVARHVRSRSSCICPRTWLLREGWRKHGAIRFGEVPSARIERRAR